MLGKLPRDGCAVTTHIPNGARTYCGREVAKVVCINIERDCIEDATCKACTRGDGRRVREANPICKKCRLPRVVSSDHEDDCTWHPRSRVAS